MSRINRFAIAWAAATLIGCGNSGDRTSSYAISIATSGQSKPHAFAGSFQFFHDDQRITRELSGSGAQAVNFDAQRLVFVRIHGNDADSLYSMSVSRDGAIEYESGAVAGDQPLIYYARSEK